MKVLKKSVHKHKMITLQVTLILITLMIIAQAHITEAQQQVIPPGIYTTSWALLIGINKYLQHPRLNYAVNDVDALAKLLIELFDFPPTNVITLKDEQATQKNILDHLSNLADTNRIGKGDRVLVFFSGHGQTVPLPNGGEMGFLIPYDAEVNLHDVGNPGQYYKSCIGMDELKRRSFAIPAKHVLFLVDSCYSGLAAESRGGLDPNTPGLLEKVAKLPVRHIITAGLKGEKAFEKPEWGHGAFTYKLLEALKTGASDWNNDSATTGEELGTYLRNVVPNIAPQTPHQGRFEGEGEFLFMHERWKPTSMVLIPAGEFLMGSPEGEGDSNEQPRHTVYLDAFYMDKYEVTNSQYKKFMDATGHPAPHYWYNDKFNKPDQPVVGVTWFDAEAYCKWSGKRLPTEAEWEKAARGGLEGKKYPWGDESPDGRANRDGLRGIQSVGNYSPNGYGIYDMSGNVWEWCADWYDEKYYSRNPSRNPKGPDSGTYRVLRGGSWSGHDRIIRVAYRGAINPFYSSNDLGFRCARDVIP